MRESEEKKEEIKVKSHVDAFRDDENWEREIVERKGK